MEKQYNLIWTKTSKEKIKCQNHFEDIKTTCLFGILENPMKERLNDDGLIFE